MFNSIPSPSNQSQQSYINSMRLHLSSVARNTVAQRYSANENTYPRKKINELIYNDDTHYSSIFKEFLIFEDENEFLKKYHPGSIGIGKMKEITLFYHRFSKMFPNYIILPESCILYKNIQKKQKMIDKLQQMKKEEEEKRLNESNMDLTSQSNEVFDTTAKHSILNESNSFLFNIKNILNVKEDNNDDSESSYVNIEKMIEVIDDNEKIAEKESMTSRRENDPMNNKNNHSNSNSNNNNNNPNKKQRIILCNQKSKLFTAELSKYHSSLSPMIKGIKMNVAVAKHAQNASSSTNTTSILSTINNSKDKTKKASLVKKIDQFTSVILSKRINYGTIASIKKHNVIPVILSSPKVNNDQNNNDDSSLNAQSPRNTSSLMYKKGVIRSQSQSNNITISQRDNKKTIIHSNSNSNYSLLNNSNNNVLKIIGKNIHTKFHKKIMERDYMTHRGITDMMKVGLMNHHQSPPSHELSSKTQHHHQYQQHQKQQGLNKQFPVKSAHLSPIYRSNKNHNLEHSPINSYHKQNSSIELSKNNIHLPLQQQQQHQNTKQGLFHKKINSKKMHMDLSEKYGVNLASLTRKAKE